MIFKSIKLWELLEILPTKRYERNIERQTERERERDRERNSLGGAYRCD